MATYNISLSEGTLQIGFCTPAQNDEIVKDAEARLDELVLNGILAGGEMIRINGPASLPVAMVLAHKLAHLYGTVACFDPKLSKYVVAIAHGGKFAVGDLID